MTGRKETRLENFARCSDAQMARWSRQVPKSNSQSEKNW